MRNPVYLQVVQSQNQARALGLYQFARGFNHEIEPAFPIIAGWIGGTLRGYLQMERRWLVTPAIHPELNSPREVLELARSTIGALRQNQETFLLQREDRDNAIFSDSVMEKLGLRPWPYHLYAAR